MNITHNSYIITVLCEGCAELSSAKTHRYNFYLHNFYTFICCSAVSTFPCLFILLHVFFCCAFLKFSSVILSFPRFLLLPNLSPRFLLLFICLHIFFCYSFISVFSSSCLHVFFWLSIFLMFLVLFLLLSVGPDGDCSSSCFDDLFSSYSAGV